MEPRRHFDFDRPTASSRIGANLPKPLRVFFAVFMALVFVFVGLMLIFNWFNVIYDPATIWKILRFVGGPIFVLYGLYRGYKFYKGSNADE